MRSVRSRLLGALLWTAASAGCGGGGDGTFVVVTVLPGNVDGAAAVTGMDVTISLAGSSQTVSIDLPGTAAQLPKTFSLQIQSGEGLATVKVDLENLGGVVGTGRTTDVPVSQGETTRIDVTMGVDAPAPDGGVPDAGGPASIEVTPTAETLFGSAALTTTTPGKMFLVGNVGGMTSGAVTVSVIPPDHFQVSPPSCPPIASRGSCAVTVTFAPASLSPAEKVAFVRFVHNGVNLDRVVRGLATCFDVDMRTVQFGNVQVAGSSGVARVMVTNRCAMMAGPLAAPALGGPHAAEFRIEAGSTTCTAGLTLQPNETCVADLKFMPVTAGGKTATLTIAADSGQPGNAALIALTGTGAL